KKRLSAISSSSFQRGNQQSKQLKRPTNIIYLVAHNAAVVQQQATQDFQRRSRQNAEGIEQFIFSGGAPRPWK
ncbi:hypothetical protein Dimus_018752, partial [Dionaea muscipula]